MKKIKISYILFGILLVGLVGFFVWFFTTEIGQQMGLSLLVAVTGLIMVDVVIHLLMKRTKRIARVSVGIVIGIINFLVIGCVSIVGIIPTQLFYYHFDQENHDYMEEIEYAEEVSFDTSNGKASGWMIHNAEDKAPIILYFGGNGENSCTHMRRMIRDEYFNFLTGYNMVFIDYPGYGESEGKCSDETLRNYGVEVYDAIASRDDVDADNIIVWGYSIGTGISNYVASERNVRGLILMAPYSNGFDLVNGFVNIFYGPARLMVAYQMPADEFATKVQVKPLILASFDDEIIQYQSSEKLSTKYPKGSELIHYIGTYHNNFIGNYSTYELVCEYLNEVCPDVEPIKVPTFTRNALFLEQILAAAECGVATDKAKGYATLYSTDDLAILKDNEALITQAEDSTLRMLIYEIPTTLGDRIELNRYYEDLKDKDVEKYLKEYCNTLQRDGQKIDTETFVAEQLGIIDNDEMKQTLDNIAQALQNAFSVYEEDIWSEMMKNMW